MTETSLRGCSTYFVCVDQPFVLKVGGISRYDYGGRPPVSRGFYNREEGNSTIIVYIEEIILIFDVVYIRRRKHWNKIPLRTKYFVLVLHFWSFRFWCTLFFYDSG